MVKCIDCLGWTLAWVLMEGCPNVLNIKVNLECLRICIDLVYGLWSNDKSIC